MGGMGCGNEEVRDGGSVIRELRVTDIRCRCGAGPGQPCIRSSPLPHRRRVREHAELIAEGWQWQEVDPRDAGARG
jgi:hypothetical protein